MSVYDRYLASRVRLADASLPETVAVVITERDLLTDDAFATLEDCLEWAFTYDAELVVVYVSVLDEAAVPELKRRLETLETIRPVTVRTPGDRSRAETPVQISIGLGGKHEFATAVGEVAEDVADGALTPEEITATEIERRLVFPAAPDLVIKTGAERLSDFMIWQSVYSELYFTDVNWDRFRKRDYLRALREYQGRQRRFGR